MPIKTISGLPVVDARRPRTLVVTKQDIRGAGTKDPENCAVARACRRHLHVAEARIHLSRIYLRTDRKKWVRYMTPKFVRDEIIAFDRGGTFEPATFPLIPPPPSNRLLGKRQGGNAKTSRPKQKRRVPHVVTNVRSMAKGG